MAILFSVFPSCRHRSLTERQWQLKSMSCASFSLHVTNFTPRFGVLPKASSVGLQVTPLLPSPLSFSSPHLPQGRSHLIGQRSCHDHDISLTGTCSEHHTEAVHVVTRCGHVHHLHSAAGQAKGHGPQRALRGQQSSDGSTEH